MDSWDFKEWRKSFGFNQYEAAEQLGVGRTTIQNWEADPKQVPYTVELACIELTRRWKRRPDFGPVLLVYADGAARYHGIDPTCPSLLHCEPHASNEAAIRQVLRLRDGPELLDPVLIFILEQDGEIIWGGRELLTECERRKPQPRIADRAPSTTSAPSTQAVSKRGRKRPNRETNGLWSQYLKTGVR